MSDLLEETTGLTGATPPTETGAEPRAPSTDSLTTTAGTVSRTPGIPALAGREPSPPDRRGRVETMPSELSARCVEDAAA